MKYAILINDRVNLIKCDTDFAASHSHVITVNDDVQSGWIKNNQGKLVAPSKLLTAGLIAEKIKLIKEEANRRILKITPAWKQRNMLARGLELQNKGVANWTTTEQQEIDAIRSIWVQIKTIRKKSDDLENQVKDNPDITPNFD